MATPTRLERGNKAVLPSKGRRPDRADTAKECVGSKSRGRRRTCRMGEPSPRWPVPAARLGMVISPPTKPPRSRAPNPARLRCRRAVRLAGACRLLLWMRPTPPRLAASRRLAVTANTSGPSGGRRNNAADGLSSPCLSARRQRVAGCDTGVEHVPLIKISNIPIANPPGVSS
jgi:hypothetical protein